jgi:hypothetical protein
MIRVSAFFYPAILGRGLKGEKPADVPVQAPNTSTIGN